MKKIYTPEDFEKKLYLYWETKGYFKPNYNRKKNFCIIMPPPNVTGTLHIGHAFQQIIMDILIRYNRMKGKNTLWQVGTDHAGIATQIMIERQIFKKENKTRKDYNRTFFNKKMWKWINISKKIITKQMRRLGDSVDWTREKFTLDNEISKAVNEVFIQMYKEKLIYRDRRLVNWDTKLQTAISDLEIENKEIITKIYYIKYKLSDNIKTLNNLDYIVVATTRPETIIGDTALAVNPNDYRYNYLINKYVIIPIINRIIPIIGDESIDINKGTGCVKITPAHDFNDFNIAKKHKLPLINILTLSGNINKNIKIFNFYKNSEKNNLEKYKIPKFLIGLNCINARKKITEKLYNIDCINKILSYKTVIPYTDRSNTIVEPMLLNQWFVNVRTLSKSAILAVEKEKIKFVSNQYKNIYLNWMYNIKDWCISRNIWCGHRIPAWYDTNNNVYVGHNELEIRKINQIKDTTILHQDKDVLDTWFSSGIWTFVSLGWPNKTKELEIFHPTDVIVSGFDIIFFWIARMIMLTMHFIKDKTGASQIPFKTVYITGLIKDEIGNKMSKSKGNIIDPIDLIDGISLKDLLKKRTKNLLLPQLKNKIIKYTVKKFPNGIKSYGTDAVRFTLASLASKGRNIQLNMNIFEGYRNFCNKIWNASKLVFKHTINYDCGLLGEQKTLSISDKWIFNELNNTIKIFSEYLDKYRFDLATSVLYEFIWNTFCDWYLEFAKLSIKNNTNIMQLRGTRYTLINVLESILLLAHPIIPFITENIWQNIKLIKKYKIKTIMLSNFPKYSITNKYTEDCKNFNVIKNIIIVLRSVRLDMKLPFSKKLVIYLKNVNDSIKYCLNENLVLLKTASNINKIKFINNDEVINTNDYITRLIDGFELLIYVNHINKKNEILKINNNLIKINYEIERINNKLNNSNYINRASKLIILNEIDKLNKYYKSKIFFLKQQINICRNNN
ncbi:MAG: valine--tRNA ligase [Enterobacterales bacterium]